MLVVVALVLVVGVARLVAVVLVVVALVLIMLMGVMFVLVTLVLVVSHTASLWPQNVRPPVNYGALLAYLSLLWLVRRSREFDYLCGDVPYHWSTYRPDS